MKVAIVGYGKMGHAVEKALLQRGHQITCRIDRENLSDFDSPEFKASDVAIEFSCPAAAVDNYARCAEAGVPVVSGTTGWLARRDEVDALFRQKALPLLWAPNFSIGVNLFRRLNVYLATMMRPFEEYKPSLKEIHHIHKLDHPSGTAIALAGDITQVDTRYGEWSEDEDAALKGRLPMECVRQGEVPGTHTVKWTSPEDEISIEHKAYGRDGFAMGAVIAAEKLLPSPTSPYTHEQGIVSLDTLYAQLLGF